MENLPLTKIRLPVEQEFTKEPLVSELESRGLHLLACKVHINSALEANLPKLSPGLDEAWPRQQFHAGFRAKNITQWLAEHASDLKLHEPLGD